MRDLCGNNDKKEVFAKSGGIEEIVDIIKIRKMELEILAISALRHLSLCDSLKRKIVELGALKPCIRCISWGTGDLQSQITGLLSNLSENSTNQITMVQEGLIPFIVTLSKRDDKYIQQVKSV